MRKGGGDGREGRRGEGRGKGRDGREGEGMRGEGEVSPPFLKFLDPPLHLPIAPSLPVFCCRLKTLLRTLLPVITVVVPAKMTVILDTLIALTYLLVENIYCVEVN